MIKWFLIITLVIPRVLYSQVKLFFMSKNKEKYTLQQRYDVLRHSVIWLNKFTRRRYHLENEEIIKGEHEGGRVYVSNHFNVFEVLAFIELSKKPLIFISKQENKKVPLLSLHLKSIDTLCIDRSNVRQSLRICKQAGQLAKEGYDVVVFAEGTRSKDGNVAPFKAALPTIIHYSQVPTVLVCMNNTDRPLKARWNYPHEDVQIKFFEPLPYQFFLDNRHEFNDITRKMVQDQLDLFRKEFN